MTFLAAGWLWLLLAVAVLAAAYVVMATRRRAYAVKFSQLPLLSSVAPRRPQWWRRHVPAVLLLLALAGMVVALAAPAHTARIPKERATVMLAIDVSDSMAATDVAPNRLASAQAGALAFVDRLPAKLNLGLVSFSGTAQIQQTPTTDRDAVRAAIRNLQLGPATAIGDGIATSLTAIQNSAKALTDATGAPPATIVLLSDGTTTRGEPNDEAAAAAAAAHVPVNTIAYGTADGVLVQDGVQIPVPVNQDALQAIAQQTGGSYHRATSGDQLKSVYNGLGSSIGYRTERHDLTPWFIGFALALGLLSAGLSVLWNPRLP